MIITNDQKNFDDIMGTIGRTDSALVEFASKVDEQSGKLSIPEILFTNEELEDIQNFMKYRKDAVGLTQYEISFGPTISDSKFTSANSIISIIENAMRRSNLSFNLNNRFNSILNKISKNYIFPTDDEKQFEKNVINSNSLLNIFLNEIIFKKMRVKGGNDYVNGDDIKDFLDIDYYKKLNPIFQNLELRKEMIIDSIRKQYKKEALTTYDTENDGVIGWNDYARKNRDWLHTFFTVISFGLYAPIHSAMQGYRVDGNIINAIGTGLVGILDSLLLDIPNAIKTGQNKNATTEEKAVAGAMAGVNVILSMFGGRILGGIGKAVGTAGKAAAKAATKAATKAGIKAGSTGIGTAVITASKTATGQAVTSAGKKAVSVPVKLAMAPVYTLKKIGTTANSTFNNLTSVGFRQGLKKGITKTLDIAMKIADPLGEALEAGTEAGIKGLSKTLTNTATKKTATGILENIASKSSDTATKTTGDIASDQATKNIFEEAKDLGLVKIDDNTGKILFNNPEFEKKLLDFVYNSKQAFTGGKKLWKQYEKDFIESSLSKSISLRKAADDSSPDIGIITDADGNILDLVNLKDNGKNGVNMFDIIAKDTIEKLEKGNNPIFNRTIANMDEETKNSFYQAFSSMMETQLSKSSGTIDNIKDMFLSTLNNYPENTQLDEIISRMNLIGVNKFSISKKLGNLVDKRKVNDLNTQIDDINKLLPDGVKLENIKDVKQLESLINTNNKEQITEIIKYIKTNYSINDFTNELKNMLSAIERVTKGKRASAGFFEKFDEDIFNGLFTNMFGLRTSVREQVGLFDGLVKEGDKLKPKDYSLTDVKTFDDTIENIDTNVKKIDEQLYGLNNLKNQLENTDKLSNSQRALLKNIDIEIQKLDGYKKRL